MGSREGATGLIQCPGGQVSVGSRGDGRKGVGGQMVTTSDEEVGTRETTACRFWHVSLTVTFMPFHALVHLAMSSPTFFGDCARGRERA